MIHRFGGRQWRGHGSDLGPGFGESWLGTRARDRDLTRRGAESTGERLYRLSSRRRVYMGREKWMNAGKALGCHATMLLPSVLTITL